MEKIKSLSDLKKKREELQSNLKLREQGENIENAIVVKVAMATCGIASGAKQVMEVIINECTSETSLCCYANGLHGLLPCGLLQSRSQAKLHCILLHYSS